jgi:hypothetical protein
MTTKDTAAIKPSCGPGARSVYSAPRLVVYGDLRVITENNMNMGADGGNGNNNKST